MKSIVRGACVLAAVGVLVTVLSRYGVMGSGGGSGTVLSSYGYWTTDEGLETMLLINNPKSTDLDLTLSIHDRRGRNLVDHHFTLGGSESSNLALSTIVGKGRFGYMQITFPADVCILPAQALISNGTDGISLDMHDERDLNGAVPKAHGLIPSIAARSSSIRLILTNLDSVSQSGVIRAEPEAGTAKKALRWKLERGATAVLDYPIDPPRSGKRPAAGPLSLIPDDPSAKVVIHGYVDMPKGRMLPLHFQPALPKSSGEIAGFFSSADSQLLLWNKSQDAVEVKIAAADSKGGHYRLSRTIDGLAAEAIPFSDIPDLAEDSEGVILVRFPKNSTLLGQVLCLGGDPTLTTLKDTALETRGAYSLPVRLTQGLNTRIKVFNPGDSTEILCLFVHFGHDAYTYPLKTLSPGQYADIDLLKAREEHLPGEAGAVIPFDAQIGQIKVVLHADRNSPPPKKFVALGMIEDPSLPMSVTFQGCVSCPEVLTGLEIDPGSFIGIAGAFETFEVKAHYNESLKSSIVTSASYKDTNNHAVATVSGNKVFFHSPGPAQLQASFEDCTYVQNLFPVGGEGPFALDCECVEWGTYSATAGIAVSPPPPPPPPCSVASLQVQSPADFRISTVPAMPTINIAAMLENPPSSPTFQFSLNIQSTVANLTCSMNCQAERMTATWTPNFTNQQECMPNSPALNPAMRGGTATIQVAACGSTAMQSVNIGGQNPTRSAVQAQIGSDDTAKKIACQESCQTQFDSSGTPVVSGTGAVGIMQLTFSSGVGKTCDEVWNWRSNASKGVASLNLKRAAAANHHLSETQFNTNLVNCINDVRTTNPSFNFTPPPLSAAQKEREAIRRYNSGREHRWKVTNLMTCQGEWEVRPQLTDDPQFVAKVLNRNSSTCHKIDANLGGQSCTP